MLHVNAILHVGIDMKMQAKIKILKKKSELSFLQN
jgi:hypothetical protein